VQLNVAGGVHGHHDFFYCEKNKYKKKKGLGNAHPALAAIANNAPTAQSAKKKKYATIPLPLRYPPQGTHSSQE
jgi:hypothetical protein